MEFLWTAPDDDTFPCEQWLPSGECRGVLICIHGMSGSAADFQPLAEAVSLAGFAVFGLNLRGQGHDPVISRRGAQLDLTRLEADITAFGREAIALYPGLPVFWCGESMGALILAHLLGSGRFGLPVRGAIFSVPVVELRKPTPAPIRHLLRLASAILPGFRLHPALFVSGEAEPLKITRDEEHSRRVRASSYHITAFTLGFLQALGDLMAASHRHAAAIRQPCLVLAAGQDVFLHPDQIRAWFDRIASPDKELRVYPEAYHVLWNDFDRDLVLADILDWLDRKVPAALAR